MQVLFELPQSVIVVEEGTGHRKSRRPREVYTDLVSHAREASHPGRAAWASTNKSEAKRTAACAQKKSL